MRALILARAVSGRPTLMGRAEGCHRHSAGRRAGGAGDGRDRHARGAAERQRRSAFVPASAQPGQPRWPHADAVIWIGPRLTPWLGRVHGRHRRRPVGGSGRLARPDRPPADVRRRQRRRRIARRRCRPGAARPPYLAGPRRTARRWSPASPPNCRISTPPTPPATAANAASATAALDRAGGEDRRRTGALASGEAGGISRRLHRISPPVSAWTFIASAELGDASAPSAAARCATCGHWSTRDGADCAFTEPQHNPALIEQTGRRYRRLMWAKSTPRAPASRPAPAPMRRHLQAMADGIVACLGALTRHHDWHWPLPSASRAITAGRQGR